MEHGAGEKKGTMEKIKDKLRGGGHDADHEQTGGTVEHQGAGTGEKKGLMQKIKDKLHRGQADDQHTAGQHEGHADMAPHDAPVTAGHQQQGQAGTGTRSTPASSGTDGQKAQTGVTGTGTHGSGEKKDVVENIKEKLPGGPDGDHEHTSGTYGQRGHVDTATHGTPAIDEDYGRQGHTGVTGVGTHDTDKKNDDMENIKDKLPGGHGDHQKPDGHYGQEGHAGTAPHHSPDNVGTYGQQAHTGVTHGTAEKNDVMENIKEKLPVGHYGDHEQTSGTDGRRGHVGTATHGTPATDDAYGQQGHVGVTGMGTHATGEKNGVMEDIKDKLHGDHQKSDGHYGQEGHAGTVAHHSPANVGTYGQQAHTGGTGTGTHGTAEKKDVMENIKEKLPGSHDAVHEQTSGSDGHRGHVGTATPGNPATDDAYGQQEHVGVTGMGTDDTGEKNGVMENIKDKLPGGHGDHKKDDGHYVQEGHAGTAAHHSPADFGTYGQQAQTGGIGTGTHGTAEKKDVMENIKEKLPIGHDGDHEQTSGTYGHHGHVGTATHGTSPTDDSYGQKGHVGVTEMGTHGTGEKNDFMENVMEKLPGGHGAHEQTSGSYEQQEHTGMTGMGTHGTDEKKSVIENVAEKLPGGHADLDQTGGTSRPEGHTGAAMQGTGGTYGKQGHTGVTDTEAHRTGEKNGIMENVMEKLPGGHADHQQTEGTHGQHGHTGVTGMGTDGTGEKKGVLENVSEKLPGGHGNHEKTGGTYGQQGHTGMGTHGTGDSYGKPGHTGVTGMGTDGTGEKKDVIENIKETLPVSHGEDQQTSGTYGQQLHTGTAAHGTPDTNDTHGQHGHSGVTGGTGETKGVTEKLPGGRGDHQQTGSAEGPEGDKGGLGTHGTGEKMGAMEDMKEKLPGTETHDSTTTGGSGTHEGAGETKSYMEMIKEKLYGPY